MLLLGAKAPLGIVSVSQWVSQSLMKKFKTSSIKCIKCINFIKYIKCIKCINLKKNSDQFSKHFSFFMKKTLKKQTRIFVQPLSQIYSWIFPKVRNLAKVAKPNFTNVSSEDNLPILKWDLKDHWSHRQALVQSNCLSLVELSSFQLVSS
jgi:hypothetical protein